MQPVIKMINAMMENIFFISLFLWLILFCVPLSRRLFFNRVLAPEGELLSFASPKESNPRKGDPTTA
jgi:hypothetical protein